MLLDNTTFKKTNELKSIFHLRKDKHGAFAMDVNFEKRLLRPTNPNIISPNGLTRASRNLFGRSPGEGGSSPSSVHSPTRIGSPNASVRNNNKTTKWLFES